MKSHKIVRPTQQHNTNLYLCNLPLDCSPSDLQSLFSSYGTLTHCTILATLDSAGRRRAFLDFESAECAARAKLGTDKWVWNGYAIEVSYATVQRRGGPLTIFSAPPGGWHDPKPSSNHGSPQLGALTVETRPRAQEDQPTVVLTHLDLIAVPTSHALANLASSFGQVHHAHLDPQSAVGVIIFRRQADAERAVEALDGAKVGAQVMEAVLWENWDNDEQSSGQGSNSYTATPWSDSPAATSPTTPSSLSSAFAGSSKTTSSPISSVPSSRRGSGPDQPLASSSGAGDGGGCSTAAQLRHPLGAIQLNPTAREFTAKSRFA